MRAAPGSVSGMISRWPGVIVTVRFGGQLCKVLAYAAAGIGIAIVLLRVIVSESDDLPGWLAIAAYFGGAAVFFAAGYGLSTAAEYLQTEQRPAALPLSAAEREQERLRELPRLAREAGPALQELRREDDKEKRPII